MARPVHAKDTGHPWGRGGGEAVIWESGWPAVCVDSVSPREVGLKSKAVCSNGQHPTQG